MLIVIVIIGILIATFAPKLTGTQSTARDTGRKANLQTVGAALIKYQLDEGNYPTSGGSLDTIGIDEYLDYKVPGDPQKTRTVENCEMTSTPGQYLYVPLKKNGLNGGGLAIIASVEEDGAANRVTGTEGDGPRGCITQ
jgi:type II secretory pathway pseudopilin PulG